MKDYCSPKSCELVDELRGMIKGSKKEVDRLRDENEFLKLKQKFMIKINELASNFNPITINKQNGEGKYLFTDSSDESVDEFVKLFFILTRRRKNFNK